MIKDVTKTTMHKEIMGSFNVHIDNNVPKDIKTQLELIKLDLASPKEESYHSVVLKLKDLVIECLQIVTEETAWTKNFEKAARKILSKDEVDFLYSFNISLYNQSFAYVIFRKFIQQISYIFMYQRTR